MSTERSLWTWDDERLFFEGDYIAVLESTSEDGPQPSVVVRLLNERHAMRNLPEENRALRNKVDELTYLVNGYDDLSDKQRQRAERAEEALWALWHEENDARVLLKARFPDLVEKIRAAVTP